MLGSWLNSNIKINKSSSTIKSHNSIIIRWNPLSGVRSLGELREATPLMEWSSNNQHTSNKIGPNSLCFELPCYKVCSSDRNNALTYL